MSEGNGKLVSSAPPSPEAAPPKQAVDILVVDDNPGKLLALDAALSPLGENVVAASSGREALRQLLSRDFATVILDVNMPDMDGFETARMIRSRVRSATTPIIFVSAVNMNEIDALRGYSLGAVDYIFAPVIPEVLRAKVSVFVELHRKSEEARIHAERLAERTRELERSQRELRLSERMASIGTLCAGLGHDMGNLLLPLSVWTNSIKAADLPPELEDGVRHLTMCVQYLRRLASGLRLVSLDPSRSSGDELVKLPAWLEEIEPILRNSLPRGVNLKTDIPADLPAVRIAPHRLAQVAFNLIQNAGEVLRGRDDGLVRLWAEADESGEGVRVGLSDNGPGMPPDVLKRCLDPYFTTKTRGISTGLGLSLVHGIIRSAGSQLAITSALGRGTTFSFVLRPVSVSPPVDAVAVLDLADARLRGLAMSFAKSAGCTPVASLPEDCQRAAVWITDGADDLAARVEAFVAERGDRRVFLLADDDPGVEGVCACKLTGPRGLAIQIRRFMSELGAAPGVFAPSA